MIFLLFIFQFLLAMIALDFYIIEYLDSKWFRQEALVLFYTTRLNYYYQMPSPN